MIYELETVLNTRGDLPVRVMMDNKEAYITEVDIKEEDEGYKTLDEHQRVVVYTASY